MTSSNFTIRGFNPLFIVFTFILSIVFSSLFFVVMAQEEAAEVDSLEQVATKDSVAIEMAPIPVVGVKAMDTDNDGGNSITVTWNRSADDVEGGKVKGYLIMRAISIDGQLGEFIEVGDVPSGKEIYTFFDGNVSGEVVYLYKIVGVNRFYNVNSVLQEVTSESKLSDPTTCSAQWFDMRRINVFVGILLLSFFIIYYIYQAQRGKKLFIRKIAGMEAVDEAVGRATEMGRKIFYIFGLGDMDNMQTIASMSILGRVAEMSAEYETYIDVPVCRSMVMVTAREVVKEAYSKAGRPDVFKDDQVHYLTDDQFGYAAGVDGMFVREKPATIFYMGQFFAESLILAETGNAIGAIQIAGTAMPSQLPFFIAACDYTLIGEELFAASAYLAKEPKLLGSLKGQDIGKGVILVAILLGIVLETFGIWNLSSLFSVIE